MYRFDPTISSVVEEEAAPPRPTLSPEEPAEVRDWTWTL